MSGAAETNGAKWKVLLRNLCFSLVSLTVIFVPCVVLFAYRQMVYLLLKFLHGSDLYAMMDGDETIWAHQDKSKGHITVLAMQDYDTERNGPIYETFERKLNDPDIIKACPKIRMKRRFFMGYSYFLNDRRPYDLVKEVRAYETVDDLQKLLGSYSNEPLGTNDDGMLEILIGTKPLQWSNVSRRKHYPIIMKMHHSLGDGVSLNCLFIAGLMKHPARVIETTYNDLMKTQRNKRKPDGGSSLWKFAKNFFEIGCKDVYLRQLFRDKERNALHGPELSGDKHLAWIQDENQEYVEKVKQIKRTLGTNCSFNAIIFACISSAFNGFFAKEDPKNVPEFITSSVVTLPNIPKFEELVTIKGEKIKRIALSNKYLICPLKFPMAHNWNVDSSSGLDKIQEISNEFRQLANSLDPCLISLCVKFFAKLLPAPLLRNLMKHFDNTFGISNLPAFQDTLLFHGGHLEDVYFWIPNHQRIGMGLSIFTFRGRLEMGLIADKALMPRLQQAQNFLNDILHHIDVLHRNLVLSTN